MQVYFNSSKASLFQNITSANLTSILVSIQSLLPKQKSCPKSFLSTFIIIASFIKMYISGNLSNAKLIFIQSMMPHKISLAFPITTVCTYDWCAVHSIRLSFRGNLKIVQVYVYKQFKHNSTINQFLSILLKLISGS